jgi:hypothetical protein
MRRPDLHKRVLSLVERKKKVEADLARALARLAAATAPAAGAPSINVPAGATVTAAVDTRNVTISLALNGNVLAHPSSPQFSVDLAPLDMGQPNVLLIAPFAIDQPWAYEVQVLSDGAAVDRIADQGTATGVIPSSVRNIVVS